MAATAPVAIGTRGTVGSLLKKEIECFTKFELEERGSLWTSHGKIVETNCRNGLARPTFWLLMTGCKNKNRRSCPRFLVSICSATEDRSCRHESAKEDSWFQLQPYRILKNE